VLGLAGEVLLYGVAIGALETLGRRAPHDGADLVGFTALAALGVSLARPAAAGYLPLTAWAARKVGGALRRVARRLAPPPTVAFRLGAAPRQRPDRWAVWATALLLAGTAALLAFGEHLLPALATVKAHVSYTLYLALLGLVWAAGATVATLGLATSGQGLARGVRAPGGALVRLVPLLLAWSLAVLGLAFLPGLVPVAAAAALGAVVLLALPRRSERAYHLCSVDKSGRLEAVGFDDYVRRQAALLVALLLFVTALGQAPRLLVARMPAGEFMLTMGIGLFSSLGALVLLLRAGRHVFRILSPSGGPPEWPLVPTLWAPDPAGVPAEAAWRGPAQARGWRIVGQGAPPRSGHDLVLGGDGPAAFRPDPALDGEANAFRLERRFHVVKRREFHRRFHALVKEVTAPPRPPGQGYLFCPHAWPVPSLLRDTGEQGSSGEEGAFPVGRPYAEVFPPRLRRYLGMVLRALEIDLVYWEDAVAWGDLRRVLGVLFETYDQRRFPALERHLVGIPRVRVTIQEPEDVAPDEPAWEADGRARTPPLRARVLVVRRDRGSGDEDPVAAPPGARERPSVLV
jgi:hypothetical protein